MLKIAEGDKPLNEDEDRRRKAVGLVLNEVKGLGDGSNAGASMLPFIALATELEP